MAIEEMNNVSLAQPTTVPGADQLPTAGPSADWSRRDLVTVLAVGALGLAVGCGLGAGYSHLTQTHSQSLNAALLATESRDFFRALNQWSDHVTEKVTFFVTENPHVCGMHLPSMCHAELFRAARPLLNRLRMSPSTLAWELRDIPKAFSEACAKVG